MPLKEWNGSSWVMCPTLRVWNGSSWVALNALNNAKSARVWNGSSWVQFHPGVQLQETSAGSGITLNSTDTEFAPSSASSSVLIEMNSNGNMYYTSTYVSTSYAWLLSGANSEYYAYMDSPAGGSFTSGTVGTALQMNTTRSWLLAAYQPGFAGADYKALTSTLRIRTSSGADILTIPVTLSAYAEVV